jgi:Resolvase, N terminal domain
MVTERAGLVIRTRNGQFVYADLEMTACDSLDPLAAGIVAAARDAVQRDKRRRRAAAKKPHGPVQVVGYVRVSTEDQGDLGVGLEAQREAIRSSCVARKWQLVAIHEDVASGKSLAKRPGLDAATAAIHQG